MTATQIGAPPPQEAEPVMLMDPRPPRKQAFALTPLADVMFQLLIFFMLSSSLSPYALLPLVPPSQDGAPQPQAGPAPALADGQVRTAIWQVGRGEIRASGEMVGPDALGELLRRLLNDGTQEILLFTTADATTQDVATALEAIRVSGLARVRLIGRTGG
jgi:biopolymer transport protein ExbD